MSKNKLKFFRSVDTSMLIIYIVNIEVWVAPLSCAMCTGRNRPCYVRWSQLQTDIFFAAKDGEALYSQ